jgi:hypothetical protein
MERVTVSEAARRSGGGNWTPPEETDAEVRHWMRVKGWQVIASEYDAEREIYTWRAHSARSGHLPTLRISRGVLESYPPFAVLEHLDRLNVVAAIRKRPDARFVVVENGTNVTLEEALPEPPHLM